MTEVLYAPDRERIVATNAWAFLHWLRGARNVDLAGWAALQHWSTDDPAGFAAAIAEFARLDDRLQRLCRHAGAREAVVRHSHGARVALTRDDCAKSGIIGVLPPDIATTLTRDWPVETLIRPVAELLLHADLRPDDRVVVAGATWPWLAALLEGTTLIFVTSDHLLGAVQQEKATVLVAGPDALSNAAFPRPGGRPGLSDLRTIIASGGPLSPDARRRIYTWVKADVMLMARAGDRFWGNPLDPVLTHPRATAAFITRSAEAPARG